MVERHQKAEPLPNVFVSLRVQFLSGAKVDVAKLEGPHQALVEGEMVTLDLRFSQQESLVDLALAIQELGASQGSQVLV